MSKLLKDVRAFFESYNVMNEINGDQFIFVSIFQSINKDVLQVKIIEKNRKKISERHMFCDLKVEGITVKMTFRFEKFTNQIGHKIKSLIKSDWKVSVIGNQVMISVIEPRIDEISRLFTTIEPLCRRYE